MDDDNDRTGDADVDYPVFFLNCVCAHEREEHGWGHCDVPGCCCEGGWEE